jgi:ATP-dependent helicase/nuclease subunit A
VLGHPGYRSGVGSGAAEVGRLVHLAIDLLGEDFILDFKTDRVMQPTHHRFQLWAYAAATQKPTAHIAYLRHDRVHTFDSQALSSIHQEAESLIHSIQNGYFSPTPSLASCGTCPYSA